MLFFAPFATTVANIHAFWYPSSQNTYRSPCAPPTKETPSQ